LDKTGGLYIPGLKTGVFRPPPPPIPIKKKCRIEEEVLGFNYELAPGTLFLGEKLEVVLG